MAAGDILSVEIIADGWSADVTIDGWGANVAGVTYDFGYTGTTLGVPKLTLSVTSLGFDATGAATTRVRSIHATKAVRKAYPNQAQTDETNSSGNLVVRVALSDFVYDKDKAGAGNSGTDVAVTVLAGWANNGGASNAATLTATNSSTKTYPKMVMRRAWFNYEKIQASTYLLEVVPLGHHIVSGRPFACVKYTATDESTNSVTGTLTSWEETTRTGPVSLAVCSGSISLATLDKHELITCHLQAYPWVGDTTEVVDTTSESDLSATECGPVYFFNDKDSDYPSSIAYVQWSTSESYTGVAAAIGDNATARANPHPTIWKARQAIAARNLAQYGRNDLNGGIIYIMEGATEWCWRSSGTLDDYPSTGAIRNTDKCELLITRDPLATRANVIVNTRSVRGVGQNTIKTQRYRITDITIGNTEADDSFISGMFDGTDCCVIHDCNMNHTKAFDFTIRHAAVQIIFNAAGSVGRGLAGGTASSSTEVATLVRGCSGTYSREANMHNMLGNSILSSILAGAGNDNSMIFMNRIERAGNGVLLTLSNTANVVGHRIIGNCFVNFSNTSTNAYGISNESSTGTYRDAVIAHNSWLGLGSGVPYNGGRLNIIYNESGSQTQLKDGIRWAGNYCRQYNHKNDIFATNAAAVNNWSFTYGVASRGNVYSGSAVDNTAFYGRDGENNVAAAAIDFAAPTDGAAAGGDYTPSASSALRNRIDEYYMPIDIAGEAMRGTAGAYQHLAPFSVDATADSGTVTGTTVGIDATPTGGTAPYSYAWTVTSEPSVGAAVLDDAAIAGPTVTFSEVGNYTFSVTVTDAATDTATDTVSVTVVQTATGITVSPATQSLYPLTARQFTQSQVDQFGDAMGSPEAVTWSVDGGGVGGSVNSSGLYTAPASDGSDTVRATTNTTAIADTSVVTVGTPVFPTAGQMIVGASAGFSGSLVNGTVVLPAEAEVEDGVGFGAGGTEFVGTLVTGESATNVLPDRHPAALSVFVGETVSQTLTLLQDDETTPLSLSGKTLEIVFETRSGADVAVVANANITVSGAGSNVVTFAYPSAVTASQRVLRYALRDNAAPRTVYRAGLCKVDTAAKVDA
jgi:hypothetical protein